MKFLKNNVGRPSNKTLQKRKIFYAMIATITLAMIGGACFTVYHYTPGISNKPQNAVASNCRIPYSSTKCFATKNETIKNVQKMLNKLGYYKKSDGFDGYFGQKTVKAVRKFQKKYKLSIDGIIGPDTLEKLAQKTDTDYFAIKYNKNGGSGNLNSQYNNTQIIIYDISTPISSTKLTKNGKNHVGYTATTKINGKEYKYGCFNKNCTSSKQGKYSITDIQAKEKAGSTFYNYVYNIGEKVKVDASDGQTITMKAYYCSSGQNYDKSTSKCIASYDNSGSMTGYSVKCPGCDGRGYVSCYNSMPSNKKKLFTTTDYKYKDSKYNTVRVIAMSSQYPCGTIIEIEKYKEGTSQKKGIKAIVLDRGGAITGNKIDLLVSTNTYATKYIGRQTVNFKVLRWGW